ncbi:MAG: GGDEF domain-containing protein [Colwellia sp.]|nr:GGDEF domain-containing protein [Colwellia sp.]
MKFIKKFDRYINTVFIITIIVIIATSFFTFKEIFVRSTQKQQEAMLPLFSLITSEIIRPITVSQYMASDPFLLDYIQQEKIDEAVVFNYITSVANKFNTLSFIALEKHQLLIDSTNKITDLRNENAEWYHRLKAIDQTKFTDFGDAENPHLFFDVKMFNKQQEFLGFIGLAVDLDHFSKQFKAFEKNFGFEVYFVDDKNQVTLSSSQLMKTTYHHRRDFLTNINELEWYRNYQKAKKNNNAGVNTSNDDDSIFNFSTDNLIISQIPIIELNWRVFIVAKPVTQLTAYWQLFIQKLMIFLLVSFALYYMFTIVISNFRSDLVKDSEKDFLTQLPNRSFIHWKYAQLSNNYDHVSVVLADIDNFKNINDTYGHLFGDDVLKVIADKLSENLRSIDLVGRWGGEEFIFILPDTTAQQAQEIVDRIRQNIANIPFTSSSTSKKFNITVSFGVSNSSLAGVALEDILRKADQALYNAKSNGRNQVVVHLE